MSSSLTPDLAEFLTSSSSVSSIESYASVTLPSIVRRSPSSDPTGRIGDCFCLDFDALSFEVPPESPPTHASCKGQRHSGSACAIDEPLTSLHRASWLGCDVAVKIFHRDPGTVAASTPLLSLLAEVELVSLVRHAHINLFLGACVDDSKPFAVVYEWRTEFGIPFTSSGAGEVGLAPNALLFEDFTAANDIDEEQKKVVDKCFAQIMNYLSRVLGSTTTDRVVAHAVVARDDGSILVFLSPRHY